MTTDSAATLASSPASTNRWHVRQGFGVGFGGAL